MENDSTVYVGLDVHQSTISAAVLNGEGKLVQQAIVATQASALLDLLAGLRGELHVTLEEGTHSAWLYDRLVRRVSRLVVSWLVRLRTYFRKSSRSLCPPAESTSYWPEPERRTRK